MQKLIEGSWKKIIVVCGTLALLAGAVLTGGNVYAGEENIHYSPPSRQFNVTADQRMQETKEARKDAKGRMPMIDKRENLPEQIQEMLESVENGDKSSQAWGSSGLYPFTTKMAGTSTKKYTKGRLKKELWRGVGKLWMRFGTDWYVCTASLIDKGLLVTAAHCVHEYGTEDAGWANEVIFQPARYGKLKPYGSWFGTIWWIPSVQWDGSDDCSSTAPGVVCENDIAIVVLKKKGRRYLGQRVFTSRDIRRGLYPYGAYNYVADDSSYVSFPINSTDSIDSAQIAQFGYPVAMEGGYRMIRTDSLGTWADPYNVIIGSDQMGGTSGGPWFVNFGLDYASTSSTPIKPDMAVVAVTSWGYTDATFKIQGASRFAINDIYQDVANIVSLHTSACANSPNACY